VIIFYVKIFFFFKKKKKRTPSFASFVYISKEDFLSVIKDYQEDFEKYCQIMDNLRIYGRSQEMGSFCQFCKKFRHQMGNCPMINLVPNSHKVLGQFSKNEVQ
jgi:CRISPR/Cas system-associated protein Cas10 (large subunit of type III CRISPR-Cas system)